MIRTILAALFFIGISHAEETVACRFLCFTRAKDGTAELVSKGVEGAPVKCPLPLADFSKPFALVPVGGVIEFRKTSEDPVPVVTAKIPAGVKQALVIFLPVEDEGKLLHRTLVLDQSSKGFPESGCLVTNLYSQSVRFAIGEHQILLPAGKTAPLNRPGKRDEFNMAGVTFQFQTGETWRTASESMIRFVEGQRHLFITFVDPATKRPKLRIFQLDA